MKAGDRIKGGPCKPGKSCGVLSALIEETARRAPKAGGAGFELALSFARKASGKGKAIDLSSHTVYRAGKGTKADPATVIVLKFCPFCGAALSYEAAIEREEAQRGKEYAARLSPHRAALLVRDAVVAWMVDHGEAIAVDDVPRLGEQDTAEILAVWVKDKLHVEELPEGLRQDLGLAHLDTCEHYMCKVLPCGGGPGCEWTGETRKTKPPKCCGVKP